MSDTNLGQYVRENDCQYLKKKKSADCHPPENDKPAGIPNQDLITQLLATCFSTRWGEAVLGGLPGKIGIRHDQTL
jgi:hypothetical protein